MFFGIFHPTYDQRLLFDQFSQFCVFCTVQKWIWQLCEHYVESRSRTISTLPFSIKMIVAVTSIKSVFGTYLPAASPRSDNRSLEVWWHCPVFYRAADWFIELSLTVSLDCSNRHLSNEGRNRHFTALFWGDWISILFYSRHMPLRKCDIINRHICRC